MYSKVLAVDANGGLLKLANVSGFGQYVGNRVMIIQMKGATIDETNTSSFGNISAINDAGNYEINTVCGFLSDTMVLVRKLNRTYNANGYVQIVIMPKLTNATVVDTVKAQPWDRTTGTGGVIALELSGTLTLNKPISATGIGFTGGECIKYLIPCASTNGDVGYYYPANPNAFANGGKKGEGVADYINLKDAARGKQANGGGGGNNHNAGGGGGSNYGAGGNGGEKTNGSCKSNTPGIGGATLSTYGYTLAQNKAFMGGGGGSGHDNDGYGMSGGNGGGIVYIAANEINGAAALATDNKIMASGVTGNRFITAAGNWYDYSWSDGAGGGGAGGTVLLNVNNFTGSIIAVEAKGGKGCNSEGVGNAQCSGPGGGGGGGAIWLKNASLPATVTTTTTAGANGIIAFSALACNGSANGATSGTNGNTLFNFVLPPIMDSTLKCSSILPSTTIITLSGTRQINDYVLKAQLIDNSNVQQCILQKSNDNISFTDIDVRNNNNLFQYDYLDAVTLRKTVYYRAKLIKTTSQVVYSNIVKFTDSTSDKIVLKLYPNPIVIDGTLEIFSPTKTSANILIYDSKGALLYNQKINLVIGANKTNLFLLNYMSGHYVIKVVTSNEVAIKRFLKLPVL
ncbi:MAG: T9SS type A sorting domain-containing protein [Chitinophagaceae bacterium]|nr:T9SS type A sorting domain-containing protein [Chitinophagaceae bacterium]